MEKIKNTVMAIMYIPTLIVIKVEDFVNSFLFIIGFNMPNEKIQYDLTADWWNIFRYTIQWLFLIYFVNRDGLIGILVYSAFCMALSIFGDITLKIMEILIEKFNKNA